MPFRLISTRLFGKYVFRRVANRHRSTEELEEIDGIVERLREFLRLNYMTGAEVARRLGVRDSMVYSWLKGEFKPAHPQRIASFFRLCAH